MNHWPPDHDHWPPDQAAMCWQCNPQNINRLNPDTKTEIEILAAILHQAWCDATDNGLKFDQVWYAVAETAIQTTEGMTYED